MVKIPFAFFADWLRRHLRPMPFLSFLGGLVVGDLLMVPNPFKTALWTGPPQLRIVVWSILTLTSISVANWIWRGMSSHNVSQPDFYDLNSSDRIKDWERDMHWLTFDEVVEIYCAPRLREPHEGMGSAGWTPDECLLRVVGDFENAPRLEKNYDEWRVRQDPAELRKDGTKYTLVNHPSSETDEHFVRLELKKTKWSRVQACRSYFKQDRSNLFGVVDPDHVSSRQPRMDLTRSELPHSLCLHGFVVTSDRKVLALQRPGPERTDYYPYAWSFSFEEQLAESDFNSSGETDVKTWLHRSVRQEVLGPEVDNFLNVNNCRLLAIAIEVPIFNPFLVAYVPLECTSNDLRRVLPHASDPAEWTDIEMYDLDELLVDDRARASFGASHLAKVFATRKNIDNNPLHPTARYRIFLGLSAFLPYTINPVGILSK